MTARKAHLEHMRKKKAIQSMQSDDASDSQPAAKPAHRFLPPHFDIRTVRRFDPGQSLSFARVLLEHPAPTMLTSEQELFETFALSYADTSLITGYVGRDIVQLGHYYVSRASVVASPYAYDRGEPLDL